MLKSLYKNSLLRLFFLIIYLPVVLVLMIVILINFNHSVNIYKNYNSNLDNFISKEIIKTTEFQDIIFKTLDEKIENRLYKRSQEIIGLYNRGQLSLDSADLILLRNKLGMNELTDDIYIIDRNGIIINTTFANDKNLNLFSFGEEHKNYLLNVFDAKKFSSDVITLESSTKRLKKYTYHATHDGKYIVELGAYCNEAEEVLNFVEERLNEIEDQHKNIVSAGLFLKADKPFTLGGERKISQFKPRILEKCFNKKNNIEYNVDTLGTTLNYSYKYIKRQNSSLYDEAVICIIHDHVHLNTFIKSELVNYIVIFLVVSIILVFILRKAFRKNISMPVRKTVDILDQVGEGKIPKDSTFNYGKNGYNNEISRLATSLKKMVSNTKRNISFAKEVENGNLKTFLKVGSKEDEMGISLRNMQLALIERQNEDRKKQKQEETKKWHMEGLAKINNIINDHSGNINSLSENILSELVQIIDANIGAILITEDMGKGNTLRMVASFAYDRNKHLKKVVHFKEGLIGVCAAEQHPIILKKIPYNYIAITSGIGNARPKELIIYPIIQDDITIGVIELASLNGFEEKDKLFVEKLCDNLARAFSKAMMNMETERVKEKFAGQEETIKHLKKENVELLSQLKNFKEQNKK